MLVKKSYLLLAMILAIVVIPFLSLSQENSLRSNLIWTGNNSENWNDPLNWNPNQVPDENSNLTIPASPNGERFPIINSGQDTECNDLTIETGSSLRLRGFLSVYGNLGNNDESALIILSDELGTGSLICESENVQATVNRYLSDGVNHFIGPSVTGATLDDLFFNNNPVVYLYQYSESLGDWSAISELGTPLVPGIGYSVYVTESANKEDVIAVFKGNLRSTDLELSGNSLTYTEESPYPGYNLISNPFSSAISWDLGNWQAENISASIWLWNGSYNYLFRNAHEMGSLTGGVVPVSQAFFIKATNINPILTLSTNDRVHSIQNFYKSVERDNDAFIVLEVKKQDKVDEAWVAFCDECTNGVDNGWDTEKLYGNQDSPQLFIIESERELSINALPTLGEETKTLQLNFIVGETGQHTITLAEIENGGMSGEVQVLLKDLLEDTEQLLSLNPTYYFEASIDDSPNRFEIDIWEGPFGINSSQINNDYMIYSFENYIKIKPLHSLSNESYTIQIIDFSGGIIRELKAYSDRETSIFINTGNSYVIARIITDKSVITKKLFIK